MAQDSRRPSQRRAGFNSRPIHVEVNVGQMSLNSFFSNTLDFPCWYHSTTATDAT